MTLRLMVAGLSLLLGSQVSGDVGSGRSDLPETEPALVVLLHAYTKSASDMAFVRDRISRISRYVNADFIMPDLPLGLFSMARPEEVVTEILGQVDDAWERQALTGVPYRRVLLVGHSMGALYARKVYAIATGENAQAPFEPELKAELAKRGMPGPENPRPWAAKVDRLVLLAGMNRGWSISHHMSLTRAASMKIGVGLGRVMSWIKGHPPIIFTIRRGSPFITQLRLQWLAMRQASDDKQVGDALTVQLLGTIDDLVAPEDNIDLVTGRGFVYLDVPASGHENVVQMDESAEGEGRAAILVAAVEDPSDVLKKKQVLPADLSFQPEGDVTDVVFVVHGIRDKGYWTHKIARRVIALGREQGREVRSVTSSYGYFPMLSFLRPGARQEKVEWLMDKYTEARARYPSARFAFVGHSHGTYLAAKALRDYPAASFSRIVFAGSVVDRDYAWHEFIPQQTERVVNFVASSDWVVAFFPNALQSLKVQDLGSAGHDGFAAAAAIDELSEPARAAVDGSDSVAVQGLQRLVVGGHSAALQEKLWASIADFVLDGEIELPGDVEMTTHHPWWIDYPARAAPLIWLVIAVVLVWVLYLIIGLPAAEWVRTLAVVAYVSLLWIVLTEV